MTGTEKSTGDVQSGEIPKSSLFDTVKSISGDMGPQHTRMTPRTRQREIKRITSNLPEVYNRYFFTEDTHQNQAFQGGSNFEFQGTFG